MRRLHRELQMNANTHSIILSDNMRCIKLANNLVMHRRTKHIKFKHHYIQEKITNDTIAVQLIPTKDQLADILIKTLSTFYLNKLQNIGRLQ